MIEAFRGEFLIHPSPVEVTNGRCGYGCLYCFARARKGARKNTIDSDLKLLQGKSKSQSLCAQFVRRGYSICLSNRTDPFSKTGTPWASAAASVLAKRDNPVFIQTKGGDSAKDILQKLRNNHVVLYITVTIPSDATCKKIERGAPPTSERVKLIKWASKAGIPVIVGLNPLAEPWFKRTSLEDFEQMLLDAGTKAFFCQQLYINQTIKKALTEKEKGTLGKAYDFGASGMSQWYKDQVTRQHEEGLPVWDCGAPFPTTFFKAVGEALGKRLPSLHDFINECAEKGSGYATFNDFADCIFKGHEWLANVETKEAPKYILCRNRAVWKGSRRVQNMTSMVNVLREFWNNEKMKYSPKKNLFFRKVVDSNGNDVKDDNDNIVLHFDGEVHWPPDRVFCKEKCDA